MELKIIIFISISIILIGFFIFNLIRIYSISDAIREKELEVIELFFGKINKIPSMVEIMKKYVKHQDVFEEIIYLHKLGIIYNIKSVYDLLDLNNRIHKEFIFLMKLSTKIHDIQKDGNFLYIRNYVIFYEKNIEKEIEKMDVLIKKYNSYRRIKNLSVIGLFYPIEEKIEF
ncbi:MAG: hypothetical protein PHS92_02515 [Candidatus Gracilibacteria bacterium]|nr:hypothetical protein [Candidatus Gracilibacteria bacterium]